MPPHTPPLTPVRAKVAAMLSDAEQSALSVFRSFLVSPGEMLCFSGPQLEKHAASLRLLTEKDLLVAETFGGGYSLTRAGYAAMNGNKPVAPGRNRV